MKSGSYITASEIGEYVYCKRGWWLKARGYLRENTPQMMSGSAAHDILSGSLDFSGKIKFMAFLFVGAGSFLLLLTIIYFFFLNK